MDCALKFEREIGELPGVESVKFIPTSGRLTITGVLDLAAVRVLGRPDRYVIRVVDSPTASAEPSPAAAASESPAPTGLARILAGSDTGEFWRGVVSALSLSVAFVLERATPALDDLAPATLAELLRGPVSQWPWAALFFIVAIVFGGYSNFRKGALSLLRLDFNMGVLMSAAVIGAFFLGEWEEAAVVALLFSVSEFMESWTLARARRSIADLVGEVPREAQIVRGGTTVSTPVDSVQVGEIMLVYPGAVIPLDGEVLEGQSTANEAAITGESVPADKTAGSTVFAGTLNGSGLLRAQVTKLAGDTAVAKIVQLVEEAQANRPRSQAYIEKFAAVYTPIVLMLAAVIGIAPPLLFGQAWEEWVYRALALLLVSCPCALVVSTPITVVSAISNAARRGVLIKGGVFLEQVGSVRAIAFDKTGTLTQGRPAVADVIPLGSSTVADVLSLAAVLESHSDHPLARAIVAESGSKGLAEPSLLVESLTAVAGLGVHAVVRAVRPDDERGPDGSGAVEMVAVGNARFAADYLDEGALEHPDVSSHLDSLSARGHSVVLVVRGGEVLGLIGLADAVRPSSRGVVDALHGAGVEHITMLTGDNAAAAGAIAEQVGVDSYRANLLPEDKVAEAGVLLRRYSKVAMVGDGVNDAPALAASTVGIAMGGAGSDTALETADVALMADDLTQLPFLVQLSRASLNTIRANIYFAVAIKLIAVLLVFPGWLTLWLAILSDMGASILVSLNGLRMLGYRAPGDRR